MECLWDAAWLKRKSDTCESQDLKKRIQILDKVMSYDEQLKDVFEGCSKGSADDQVDNKAVRFELPQITVSAALIVKNEVRCIERCLKCLINEFDEIVIVDTGSEDGTVERIRSLESSKIKLYFSKWKEDFSESRNYALEKTTSDWVFFIDADEVLEERGITVKDCLAVFHELPHIENIVFSPKIKDINGDTTIGVGRIFRTGFGIRYFGLIHEEIRKYRPEKVELPMRIAVDILITHDGYTKQNMTAKNKIERNTSLLNKMILVEPDNPRWAFFYLRDGRDKMSFNIWEEFLQKYLLIDCNGPITEENLKMHQYTYSMLMLQAAKRLSVGRLDEFNDMVSLMNKIYPGNSDCVYFETFLKIAKIKMEERKILMDLLNYRKEHMFSQYRTMHSEGKHIDLLIGYLLFQTGHIKRAVSYFDLVEDAAEESPLIDRCIKIIEECKNI